MSRLSGAYHATNMSDVAETVACIDADVGSPQRFPLELEDGSFSDDEVEADNGGEHAKGRDEDGSSTPNTHGDPFSSQLCLLKALSHKTIGPIGSYAIAVNALAGPGILQLPFTYQQAGVIPTTVAVVVVGLLSALCCMHTANVVSKVPGNANFDMVVEFSDPYRIFWSRGAYYGTQIIFYLCTLCVNVAAIVDTAQVVDSFLGHSSMGTFGFSLDKGEGQRWIHKTSCSRDEVKQGECLPFEGEDYGNVLLTLGYIITALVFLPICLMDLKVRKIAWRKSPTVDHFSLPNT